MLMSTNIIFGTLEQSSAQNFDDYTSKQVHVLQYYLVEYYIPLFVERISSHSLL
jgi:hypothetical protein